MPRLRFLFVLLVLGLSVVVVACGGDAGSVGAAESDDAPVRAAESDSEVTVVASPDGLAELRLTDGALPEGVSVSDIQIDIGRPTSADAGSPILGVRLEPSGLELEAEASLLLDVGTDELSQFLVVHSSESGIEFVDASWHASGAIEVPISHFSVVTVYGGEVFGYSASLAPEGVAVGETQSMEATIDVADPEIIISVWAGPGEAAIIKLNGVEILEVKTQVDWDWGNFVESFVGSIRDEHWSPSEPPVELGLRDGGADFRAESKCLDATENSVLAAARTGVVATVAEVDTDDLELLVFGRSVAGSDVPRGSASGSTIADFTPGSAVELRINVSAELPTNCSAGSAGGTASTSSTSSLPATDSSESAAGECELDRTDASIPSIGRTGKSAVSTGLVPENLDGYEVGLAIRELISAGDLCPEHLVDLYNDNDPPGVLSPEMQAAIEAVVAEMSGSGG